MNKKTFSVILSIIISLVFIINDSFSKQFECNMHNICFCEKNAIQYLSENKEEILNSAIELSDEWNIDLSGKLDIAKPYYVYNFLNKQDTLLYFPVYSNEKILFTISIMHSDKGYGWMVSPGYNDVLNKIEYLNNKVIVYAIDQYIYFESENNTIALNNPDGKFKDTYLEEIKKNYEFFSKLDFIGKYNYYENNKSNLSIVNTVSDINTIKNSKYGTGVSITLIKPRGQHNHEMCWAASVATIVNHLKNNMNLTAYDVCNAMNIGYDAGASIYDVSSALTHYNVSYNHMYLDLLPWSKIKKCINNNKPFAIGGMNESVGYGHEVVGRGYAGSKDSTRKVSLWNPSYNNGNGSYVFMSYSSCTFDSGGSVVFNWTSTISYY